MPHRLFISFARDDSKFRDALVKHLAPLVNTGRLLIDDADKVDFVDEVRPARLAFLDAADVVVLLLSASFFADRETYRFDLPQAMARNRSERIPIVPVLVLDCEIEGTPLEGRKILPSDDNPIGSPSNDRLLTEVARSLRKVLDGLPGSEAVPVASFPQLLPAASALEKDELRELIQKVLRTFQTAPPKHAESFESVFLHSVGFQDVVGWRTKMVAAERGVCRVRAMDGGCGTGFLVSPRHVMTCAHVAAMVKDGSASFQFDYKVDAQGSMKTRALMVSGAKSVVVTSEVKDLDYAIVELPEAAGDDAFGEDEKRGFLRLSPEVVKEREPLFILQHPGGDALKMCVGGAVKVKAPAANRMYYETNTEPGSSGSPVFTIGWDLVALHHASEEEANRGIPTRLILDDLRSRNALHLLGAAAH